MKHVELFSGIGGFRKAFDLVSQDLNMQINTIAFSEIDSKAVATYNANYDTTNEVVIGDIVEFVKSKTKMNCLPQFDILSGGFPCQTFSMMGKKKGFEEERGQMFFRIMDLVKYKKPKFIILENVKNLITHNKGETFSIIKRELESSGYIVKADVFNTNDFCLPQKRNRVIIFARLKKFGEFQFSSSLVKETFDSINKEDCSLNFYESTIDLLEKEVESKYYLSTRIKPTLLSDGSAGFKSKSEIDMLVARPLTATMHKMHRACQDNYFSDAFIYSNGKERPGEYLSKEELAKISIRKLTPSEAFMLQGFPKDFSLNAQNIGISDAALYKQAGNAVSVNTIYAVVYYLISNKIIF